MSNSGERNAVAFDTPAQVGDGGRRRDRDSSVTALRPARDLSSEPEGRKAPYLIGGRQLPSGSDLGHLTDALGISQVDPFSHRPLAESLCAATLPPSSRALGLEPRVAG